MIREVARLAGVSLGTVSRVINGNATVAAELRERVERAISELGYQPNVLARGLRGGRTQSFGLVIPDVANPFFSAMVLDIEQAASRAGYCVILGNSVESPKAERVYIDLLLSRQVDGLLITPTERTRSIDIPDKAPIVAVGRPLDGIPSVTTDERQGAIQAVEYLLGLGHRNIACIAGPRFHMMAAERHRGYLDSAGPALRAEGLSIPKRTRFGAFDYEHGYRAASELLAIRPRPTAIFASSDRQAIGALRAAADIGLEAPRDLSIVGYDNISLTTLMTPRLTTVAMAGLGERGVQTLLDILAGKPVPAERQKLRTTLVVRESCGPPHHLNKRRVRAKAGRRVGSARPA